MLRAFGGDLRRLLGCTLRHAAGIARADPPRRPPPRRRAAADGRCARQAARCPGALSAALGLVEEKERFRKLERAATAQGFARLREGRSQPETSGLHLDLVRDLKRVEAHLAAIAHPLLERRNLLRPSRLVRLPRPEDAGVV